MNPVHLATPLLDDSGAVHGWYQFTDGYMSPNIMYASDPPRTLITIGARRLEIQRAVSLKIRLLEEEEDSYFWCKKRQHGQRINCAEYHQDFSDVEVAYSFSSPQTHVWFAGYMIHSDEMETIFMSSHSANIHITPEHMTYNSPKIGADQNLNELELTPSLFEMVVTEGADLPIYSAAVPKRIETAKGYITQLVPTAQFVNDCERDIRKVEAFDVGVGISDQSDPTNHPPTYPVVRPFEHQSLFWSYVENKLLAKRLTRDKMERAVKDIALLIRRQHRAALAERDDEEQRQAIQRLSYLFSTNTALHRAAFPAGGASGKCFCDVCTKRKSRRRGIQALGGRDTARTYDYSHHHHYRKSASPEVIREHPCVICNTKKRPDEWHETPELAQSGETLFRMCTKTQPV